MFDVSLSFCLSYLFGVRVDDAAVPVDGDGDDGEGGVVDGEAGPGLGHAAQEEGVPTQRPVLGQHVHRGQQHREADHCKRLNVTG